MKQYLISFFLILNGLFCFLSICNAQLYNNMAEHSYRTQNVYYYVEQGEDLRTAGTFTRCAIVIKDNYGNLWIKGLEHLSTIRYYLDYDINYYANQFNKGKFDKINNIISDGYVLFQLKESLTKCYVYKGKCSPYFEHAISLDFNTLVWNYTQNNPLYLKRYDSSTIKARASADELF